MLTHLKAPCTCSRTKRHHAHAHPPNSTVHMLTHQNAPCTCSRTKKHHAHAHAPKSTVHMLTHQTSPCTCSHTKTHRAHAHAPKSTMHMLTHQKAPCTCSRTKSTMHMLTHQTAPSTCSRTKQHEGREPRVPCREDWVEPFGTHSRLEGIISRAMHPPYATATVGVAPLEQPIAAETVVRAARAGREMYNLV